MRWFFVLFISQQHPMLVSILFVVDTAGPVISHFLSERTFVFVYQRAALKKHAAKHYRPCFCFYAYIINTVLRLFFSVRRSARKNWRLEKTRFPDRTGDITEFALQPRRSVFSHAISFHPHRQQKRFSARCFSFSERFLYLLRKSHVELIM